MKGLMFFAVFFLLVCSSYGLKFNEIMYDVVGSDDDREWLEIYNENNSSINIQSWKFFEDGTNHNIVSVLGDYMLNSEEYAVVAEDPLVFLANYPNYTETLFDSTFSLSNTGETIALKNKTGQVQDNFTYSFIMGGNENGYSIGLRNDIWKETFPSPGKENIVSNICDWSVLIISGLIFEDKYDFSWKVKTQRLIGEQNIIITIKREIQDIYGNVVRSYADANHNLSNSETLSYDPNLNQGTYLLKAEIVPSCNDSNKDNNVLQKLVAVKDTASSNIEDSSVKIEQIYDLGKDKKAEFGQLIRVKIKAYRGDSTKQVVSLWIESSKEKISKVLSFKLLEKYSEQDLTLPVQIFPNCDNKLKSGDYKIIVEGFGEEDSRDIEVYNNIESICGKQIRTKEEVKEPKTSSKNTDSVKDAASSETLIPQPKNIFNSAKPYALSTVVFESSQRKAEELVPYFIGTIMTLTTLFLLFSRT
ncbi:TPA: lamin tail domain-containing protein [Candidatus Woesearchaeota archaeon]|nr:lamin tail domain-containing protein [Candidatus Woesearchaeota archaeon]